MPKRPSQPAQQEDDTMIETRKSRLTIKLGAAALVLILAVVAIVVWWPRRPKPPITALQERAVFVEELTTSGPVPNEILPFLESKVRDLWAFTFDLGKAQLIRYHRDEKDFRGFDKIQCFKNGCMTTLTFADQAAASIFEEDLLVGPMSPLRHWPGKIYRGPFIPEREGVTAVWALLPNPTRYKGLESLPTDRHAINFPNDSMQKTTVSDLRQGEP
jgi:hypothetical protein